MESFLNQLREAYREEKKNVPENSKLQDIIIKPQTREVEFVWEKKE